jgi:hypothetical protein
MLAALTGHEDSIEHTTPDGRSLDVPAAPFIEDDRTTGVLTVWHDVTEQTRLQR